MKATTIRSLNGPALRLRGGGTVTSLAARGGPGSAAIAIDPAALGKLAFNVAGVSAQGGNEPNPGDSPGSGLTVTRTSTSGRRSSWTEVSSARVRETASTTRL